VIGTLKAAFVQCRLARDEFDLRVGRAFAALPPKTWGGPAQAAWRRRCSPAS